MMMRGPLEHREEDNGTVLGVGPSSLRYHERIGEELTRVEAHLLGLLMDFYHRSPFYPRWGLTLARLLAAYHKRVGRDLGSLVWRRAGTYLLTLDLQQAIDNQLYYAGTYEAESINAMAALVRPGDTVIDVGANIGWMTLHLAGRVGSTGRVLAFEPAPGAAARLKQHVQINGFDNVDIIPLALGDRTQGPRPIKIRSTYRLDGVDDTEQAMISTVTLDHYLREHPAGALRFIKIDTDGREAAVFRGSAATLSRYRPNLLFEVAPDSLGEFGSAPDAILSLLERHGYRFLHVGNLKPYADVRSAVARIPPGTTLNLVAVPAG